MIYNSRISISNFSIPNEPSFRKSSNTQKSQFGSRFFSFVTDDEFFPKWNACRVDGQTQMTLLQRKLMTIFSPPPTIHLVVVTSLPFGFALMSRRGVNQTFFCENNQNSIKHLCMCASKTPNFYVWKILGIEQRKQKYVDLVLPTKNN